VRLRGALRRVVFLVVPSAVAFVAIGGPIVSLLVQSGRFTAQDTTIVWIILAGSAVGLSAATQGRLLGSAFYALGDTHRPLYAALVRVAITGIAGVAFALPLRHVFGYSEAWGAFGLTASAGFGGWIEFLLLDRWLGRRIGKVPVPGKLGFGALAVASLAGAAGFGVTHVVPGRVVGSILAIVVFGVIYLGVMAIAQVPEANALFRRFTRRLR
jgi:putative peptidoglycan lipid II flippase